MSRGKKGGRRLRSLEIRRAKNGVTVRHESEPSVPSAKQSGMSIRYDAPEEHVFDDHNAAKAHVLKHMNRFFGGAGAPGEADPDPDADGD